MNIPEGKYEITEHYYEVSWDYSNPMPEPLLEKVKNLPEGFAGDIVTTHFNGKDFKDYDWGSYSIYDFYFKIEKNVIPFDYFTDIVNDMINGEIEFVN